MSLRAGRNTGRYTSSLEAQRLFEEGFNCIRDSLGVIEPTNLYKIQLFNRGASKIRDAASRTDELDFEELLNLGYKEMKHRTSGIGGYQVLELAFTAGAMLDTDQIAEDAYESVPFDGKRRLEYCQQKLGIKLDPEEIMKRAYNLLAEDARDVGQIPKYVSLALEVMAYAVKRGGTFSESRLPDERRWTAMIERLTLEQREIALNHLSEINVKRYHSPNASPLESSLS